MQFAATVNAFEGKTKAEALKSIDSIKLGGSTALYGATIQGLEMLKGKERPTLVLFTDGKNELAAGGLTDKSVVVEAIAAAGVPVYTIGFGPEHAPPPVPEPNPDADPDAPIPEAEVKPSDIRDFATLSDGRYYSAADQDALSKVFERWAMLEIDCKTYETISVLDDGGNSSMCEFLLTYMKGPEPGDYLSYICGAMMGVSTGVWSMSAASLITSDYEEAIQLAAMYAGYANEKVKQFFELWGASKDLAGLAGGSGGGSKGMFGAEGKLGSTGLSNDPFGGSNELKFGLSLGPAAGFEKGLEYYFSML